MNKHTVFVAGERFVLLSEDNTEYVAQLAKEVNGDIKRISDENPTMESRSCAILCALDYADDKKKEIERSKSLSENAKTVMIQADKHAKQIKELKEKLAKKEKEAEKLTAENTEQKAKIEKLLKDNKKFEEANIKLAEENGKLIAENKKLAKEAEKDEKSSENNNKEKTEKSQKNPPAKKEKHHNHPHINPYKKQALENSEKQQEAPAETKPENPADTQPKSDNTEETQNIQEPQESLNKGYKPIRQISLFDNE